MTSRERHSTTLVKDCSGVFFFLFYGDLHFFVICKENSDHFFFFFLKTGTFKPSMKTGRTCLKDK